MLCCRGLQEKSADVDQTTRIAPQGHEPVLLVDDEAALLDVGMKILGSLGYQVTATENAAEALELFKNNPAAFDVVITDQTMPRAHGL